MAQIRIEVASLQELMTQVREAFGLSPTQVLARELGPKWEAIAAFIKDFRVGAQQKYLRMKPADALARFGAPTDIGSEYWTWRRENAEIVPEVFSIRIRFREVEGAAEVEMTK